MNHSTASEHITPISKAFNATTKAVLSNTTVETACNDGGSKKGVETKINTQTNYSVENTALRIQSGINEYVRIAGAGFSSQDLAKVRAKYPKAKYFSSNLSAVVIGSDAPTYLTGYIVEMAKSSTTVIKKRKGNLTKFSFKSNSISKTQIPDECNGFTGLPVNGYITIDRFGRIQTAYASTTNKLTTLIITYSYDKLVQIKTPNPSETITQEKFYAELPDSVFL